MTTRRLRILGAVAVGLAAVRIAPPLLEATRQWEAESVRGAGAAMRSLRELGALARTAGSGADPRDGAAWRAVVRVHGEDRGAAALVTVLSQYAEAAGLELSHLGVRAPADSLAPFASAVVSGAASGDVHGLTQFLLLVEQAQPVLGVRRIVVRGREDVSAAQLAESLAVEFEIDGTVASRRGLPR